MVTSEELMARFSDLTYKFEPNMPEKQKMIDFILEIMPNVKLIVELATDDQLIRLYEQAQYKLNYQLDLI